MEDFINNSINIDNKSFIYKIYEKIKEMHPKREREDKKSTKTEEELIKKINKKIFDSIKSKSKSIPEINSPFNIFSEDDILFIKFFNVLLCSFWNIKKKYKNSIENYNINTNTANVDDMIKFFTASFSQPFFEFWCEKENVMVLNDEYESLCEKCFEKIFKDSLDFDGYNFLINSEIKDNINLNFLLNQIYDEKNDKNFIDQFTDYDYNKNQNLYFNIRSNLEEILKNLLYFLYQIPYFKTIISDCYNQKIETKFKKPNISLDKFIEKNYLTPLAVLLYSINDQLLKDKLYQSNNYVHIFPKIDYKDLMVLISITNEYSHGKIIESNYNEKYIYILKKFITDFKKLEIIPKTVVFYRKEEDIFGIHYKGNTIDNKPYIMFMQKDNLVDLGKYYFVSSLTKPVHFAGYVVPVKVK